MAKKGGLNRPPGLLKKRFVTRFLSGQPSGVLQLLDPFVSWALRSPERFFSIPGPDDARFAADYEIPQGLDPGPVITSGQFQGPDSNIHREVNDAVCLAVPGITNLTARPAG